MGKKPAYSVVIALSIISTLVVTLFLGGIATTVAQDNSLALYVSSTSALANQRISLSGTGFTANGNIGEVAEGETQVSGITLEGKDIPWDRINGGNTVSIDSDGAWSATVDLPVNAVTTAEGYKTIKATDSTGVSDTREIRIKQRVMFIDPDSELVGTIALVVGGGFPARNDNVPSFPVTITYDTGSGTGTTQSVVPHANGEIRANLRIPTTASIPSSNTVKVSFQDDDGVIVEETTAHEVLPSLIDFYPTTGIPGNTFYVIVAGYKPYVPVQSVTLNGRDMSQGRQLATDVDGKLEFGFHIPPMDPATYPVEFVLGGRTFSSSFTLRAGPTPIAAPTATPTPSPTPTVTPTPTPAPDEPPEKIRLSRSSGPPGAVVTVYGEGFHPFLPMRRVDVGDIKASPDPRPSTDKDGRITFDVIIPSLEPGTYHFDVKMGTSVSGNFAWVYVDFTVTALPTPTPSPVPTVTPAPTLAPQLPGAKEPPHVFMGTARLDGFPVAEGTPISAYDGTRLVGATESGPNGKFGIHTHRSSNSITFAVDNRPASEVWSQWESGRVTRGFHLTAGSFSHSEDLPETLFRDNPSLEVVFFYDNARKVWEFYDPLIGNFNTLEKFVSGQPYLFLVKRNAWVVMNGTERHLYCVDDNCWNQIVW
ncbi:MAG: hypothetical protein OXI91_08010 [Chloroflexota bacterium]|nr:hypothetical protein [Chloroflexota bacterium]